ncbi:MAG: stage III sporulation protein AE [Lachnospiraceae bacterium]|nr:stage III sporulation protein AE [Lachnospiraceae bacterium]
MKKIWTIVIAICLIMAPVGQADGAIRDLKDRNTVYNMQMIQEATDGDLTGFQVEDLEDFDAAEIQDFLDSLNTEAVSGISFQEMMKEIMAGNLMEVFQTCAETIKSTLFSELRTNYTLLGQILLLALIGAIFSGFAGIFGSGHVSETGFYVVYLLAMAFLAASFFSSVVIASEVTTDLLEFMQVLLPAYFLAVTMAGGAITSAAICGFTIGAIGLVQAVFGQILIPLMRVYMMMVLAGNLYKEEMLSKLTELLGNVVFWTCKTMFGIIVGFHVIQGLVLPQADALKNASAMRLAQMIPGIGGGAGAVSQMVLGSGILIKNTAGAVSVVILLLLAAVPMMKLFILMVLYYLAAAAMQPVCDKRLVACMTGAAAGHGLLLKMVGYSLALFGATIAVICVSTNAAWYAG